MQVGVQGALALAAVLFIVVSMIMNALFMSSLGRTSLEIGLLASVSVAADIVKVVLPIVIMRALCLRAWVHASFAITMLVVVVVLSLVSGTGFVALTRGGAAAVRDTKSEMLASRKQQLREIETRIATLTAARPSSIVEAELAGLRNDRRWSQSRLCVDVTAPSLRQFCAEISRLRVELATAGEFDKLIIDRERLRGEGETLGQAGVGSDSDPQVNSIAVFLGINPSLPRTLLSVFVAGLLELGSVTLVLLAAGPAVRGWQEPIIDPPSPPVTAEVPTQPDRAYWRRQRERDFPQAFAGGGEHARS